MPKPTLLDALKRKFRTPEEALSKLGIAVDSIAFDEAILGNTKHYQETTMSRLRLAYDQSPSIDSCLNAVRAFIDGMESPEERREFMEGLAELISAEPRPNEEAAAMDRARNRRLAQDAARYRAPTAATERQFAQMFPGAARIGRAL